jgi:hypothetical protein
MDYKAEPLETNFGKGIKLEKGRRSYEQFSCKDGLFVRVYQAPHEKYRQIVNTDYHGVVFRAPFQDTDQDYEQFRILAERLQQASGEEVPNSKARFMGYISHSGLEQELSRIGGNVRINLKDQEDLPKNANSWLNSKGHWGGLITDLGAYAAGFWLISQHDWTKTTEDGSTRNMIGLPLTMFGLMGPFIEGMLGADSTDTWCGPVHAIGFVPTKRFFKSKMRNPNYMLGNFMQNYQRLDAMGSSVGNQKEYAKQSKKADRHFGVLEDMFPFTKHQKGFSITYDSPDRDNILNFFDYILEGGNAPQLPSPQAKAKKPREKKESIETQPVETNFINPWEVQIPKLGGKKK